MEQRPPRLGDIVDDYCPRERRVTNHAIVAIVEDAIRQTRCTTCDADHVFKGGREPRRRIKPSLVPGAPPVIVEITDDEQVEIVVADQISEVPAVVAAPVSSAMTDPPGDDSPNGNETEASLAHRRLIRATLPKVEGEQPVPRPIPEFTMHQRPQHARPGRFRFEQNHNGRGHGGFHRGRPLDNNGHAPDSDEDEINGNVAGPPQRSAPGAPPGGPGGQGGPGQGRRRRGRRRRGR